MMLSPNETSLNQEHVEDSPPITAANCRPKLSYFKNAFLLMASPVIDDTGSFRNILAGLFTISAIGSVLGLFIAPKNQDLVPPYQSISSLIGYIYFLAWSVSFYPQSVSNFKRKNTDGLSVDFCLLNVIGFACYAVYNVSLFWNKSHSEILIQSNDVAFAVHAFIVSSITLCQILYYDGMQSLRSRMSKPIVMVVAIIILMIAIYPLLVIVHTHRRRHTSDEDKTSFFNWLNYLYMLSYVKIFISLIKYIPQVLLNYRRKSTAGWSIWNILLDFTGGVLSDLQLLFDCMNLNDFNAITKNLPKLCLGSLSIIFDCCFFVQHYLLYRNTISSFEDADSGTSTEPLLPPPTTEPSNVDEVDNDGERDDESIADDDFVSNQQPQLIFV